VNLATRAGYSANDLLATDEVRLGDTAFPRIRAGIPRLHHLRLENHVCAPCDLSLRTQWAWIDPGVFATVGAGAFMGGGTRQALSAAVILVETTGEVHFLLPIMLSIAIAKWTADALLSHGLYHSILEHKGVPFLPSEPPVRLSCDACALSLELFASAACVTRCFARFAQPTAPLKTRPVRDIMCIGPVVCVAETGALADAQDALRHTRFHGFPVVRPLDGQPVMVGLISREHLKARGVALAFVNTSVC
jgi:chloride channel 7